MTDGGVVSLRAAREINITNICRINANNSRQAFRRVCCCSRRDYKRTPHEASSLIPHGYYFLFYYFLYAPRISVALLLQTHTRTWNNASADTHNVVVKAFYIEPTKKKKKKERSLFANSAGKTPPKSYGKKLSGRRLHTPAHPIAGALARN